MEHLVWRIHATNYLYFIKDELDIKGIEHNKPLYITIRCKDLLIGKVFIDNGSTFNMLPKYMLKEMHVNESHIKSSVMTTKTYNGSPK